MPDTASTRPEIAGSCQRMQQELQNAGLRVLLFDTPAGQSAGGLPLAIELLALAVGQEVAIPPACFRQLQQGAPVNLSIGNLGASACSEAALARICEQIRRSVDAACLSSGLFGIALYSHQLPLDACQPICQSLLGRGPRYVIMDSLPMQHHLNPGLQQQADDNWRFLWQQRGSDAPFLPVYAACVRTACPLLSDEASRAVLPTLGVPVPEYSAWLPVQLHLPNFSDGQGILQWPLLRQALEICLELGNRLLDALVWPTELQAIDARQNRRLAILATGIGDLVVERHADPGDLACLQQICDEVAQLRGTLCSLSAELARRDGPLPALLQYDMSVPWHDPLHRQRWHSRWHAALQATAVRNRNLLVLSPYSVLPEDSRGAVRYSDLLPVLKFADAWSFANPSLFDGWNAAEFGRFHRRAWATITQQNGACFVADGV